MKAHEDADGRTRLQKRKTFLDSKKAIKQYKRDNPDAFNYHEQARKHKADNDFTKKEKKCTAQDWKRNNNLWLIKMLLVRNITKQTISIP